MDGGETGVDIDADDYREASSRDQIFPGIESVSAIVKLLQRLRARGGILNLTRPGGISRSLQVLLLQIVRRLRSGRVGVGYATPS